MNNLQSQKMVLSETELADCLQIILTPPTIPAQNIVCKYGTKTPFKGLQGREIKAKKEFLLILTFAKLDNVRSYLKTKEANAVFFIYCLDHPTNAKKYYISQTKFW